MEQLLAKNLERKLNGESKVEIGRFLKKLNGTIFVDSVTIYYRKDFLTF
jgi:hypothetical protein